MTKTLTALAVSLLVIAIGAVTWPRAQTPPLTPDALTVSPADVVIGTPTQVTFTIDLHDVQPTPTRVNLLTTDGAGNQILATAPLLHDDGMNGDIHAADSVYSFRQTLSQASPGVKHFRVGLVLPGVTGRTLSNIVTVHFDAGISTAMGTITSHGGTILDLSGKAVLDVPQGAINGTLTFTVISISRSKLHDFGIDTTLFDDSIAGAVDVEPSPRLLSGPPGPTAGFNVTVHTTLNTLYDPGTVLDVLGPTRSGIGWQRFGVIATVEPDRATATFTTNRVGIFILIPRY